MAARELGAERQGPSASTSAVAALVQEGRSSSEGATEEAVHELDEDADASRPGGEEATGPVIIRVRGEAPRRIGSDCVARRCARWSGTA